MLRAHTPFFCCSFFEFIFWALLSISRAVSLCVKPLNTKGTSENSKHRQMWIQTHDHVTSYHSFMISDVLERDLTSEVGDLLLKTRRSHLM